MAMDDTGLTSDELVAKLKEMDQILLSDTKWTTEAGAVDIDGKSCLPDNLLRAVKWSIQGAAWRVVQRAVFQTQQFPYRQICMALHATMNQPMVMLQEHEGRLTFAQMKEWLAKTIEYAKANDPWTPFVIEHPQKLL